MNGIERRAKRALFSFTFIDPQQYVGLDHYRATSNDFTSRVTSSLPPGWTVRADSGIWHQCQPPVDRMPDHGFKIHVSAAFHDARALLDAVVPVLVNHEVAFKYLADPRILDFANSQVFPRTGCGKFITVYPAHLEQFKSLMDELHAATSTFVGPYILSDRRHPHSKVLFYRYGAFRNIERLNIYGEKEACLRGADGQLQLDQRQPYFVLPEGVEDPYGGDATLTSEPVLNGRYKVKRMLASSSKGGVYLCDDLTTGTEVVVKEARPLINLTRSNPYDAVACLHHEFKVLKRLAPSGYTPRPIEMFQEWEHWFLAMEKMEGTPLSSFRAYETFSIMLQTEYTDERLRAYCGEFVDIAGTLLAAMRRIHALGVVIQDFAPQNVLVSDQGRCVRMVDFESAYITDAAEHSPIIDIGTVGFSRQASQSGEKPSVEDDYHALSSVLCDLLFPVGVMFPLNPKAKESFFRYISREKGLPPAIVDLLLEMGRQHENADQLLEAARASVAEARRPLHTPPINTPETLDQAIDLIVDHMHAQLQRDDSTGLLPTDYRRYVTNPLGLAYGYTGIAQFLHTATGNVPLRLEREILKQARAMHLDDYSPGLYVGCAGIAWALELLGQREDAQRVLALGAQSQLLHESADVFYGSAGWGLAQLFFHARTGEDAHLQQAVRAAEQITPRLELAPEGLCYRNLGDAVYFGYAHGSAGIAQFYLRLHQATGDSVHLDIARRLLDYELAHAQDEGDHYTWHRSSKDTVKSPYLRIGNAGICAGLLRMYEVSGESRYLDAARKAAAYLFGKVSVFPGLLQGTAGIGEMFVDLHRVTGEERYRQEALCFADRTLLFRVDRPEGMTFPGDELVRISTDLATGSAGIGLFFHRLAHGGPRAFHDF